MLSWLAEHIHSSLPLRNGCRRSSLGLKFLCQQQSGWAQSLGVAEVANLGLETRRVRCYVLDTVLQVEGVYQARSTLRPPRETNLVFKRILLPAVQQPFHLAGTAGFRC